MWFPVNFYLLNIGGKEKPYCFYLVIFIAQKFKLTGQETAQNLMLKLTDSQEWGRWLHHSYRIISETGSQRHRQEFLFRYLFLIFFFYYSETLLYEHFLETIFAPHIKGYFNDTLGLGSYYHVKKTHTHIS